MKTNLKQNISYNIRRALPLLCLAGIGLVPTACTNDDEPDITHDVNLYFSQYDYSQLELSNVYKAAKQPDVGTVYLIPLGNWRNLQPHNIHNLRENVLEPAIKVSPKVRGGGDFIFWSGEASQVPTDSLWYIQNGWTINKLSNQR